MCNCATSNASDREGAATAADKPIKAAWQTSFLKLLQHLDEWNKWNRINEAVPILYSKVPQVLRHDVFKMIVRDQKRS